MVICGQLTLETAMPTIALVADDRNVLPPNRGKA